MVRRSGIRSAHYAAEEHSQRANKSALGRYVWVDPGPAARAARRADGKVTGFYLYTEHAFELEDVPNGRSQVQAVMNDTINNISHDFINAKLPGRSVTCIRIPSAQYRHNMNTRGAIPRFVKSKTTAQKSGHPWHPTRSPRLAGADRGTALKTIKAQYALPWWTGGTVVQTSHSAIYD